MGRLMGIGTMFDICLLPPPRGGSTPKGGWGCLLTNSMMASRNTPSVASRHLPRKTVEERYEALDV